MEKIGLLGRSLTHYPLGLRCRQERMSAWMLVDLFKKKRLLEGVEGGS